MTKEWNIREFINGVPIEEYTEEEINNFFQRAIDRAFKAIGYEPVEDE